jgi:hypothetical protein
LTGCTHLGPKPVTVGRFDYSAAIADSWKQQTLLNIVKLRYADLPVFMDAASIVSGYRCRRAELPRLTRREGVGQAAPALEGRRRVKCRSRI